MGTGEISLALRFHDKKGPNGVCDMRFKPPIQVLMTEERVNLRKGGVREEKVEERPFHYYSYSK